MKAAFAGALGGLQNLDHDEVHERPVDRLGAMGFIGRKCPDERLGQQVERSINANRTAMLCSLGVDLVRFKFANVAPARLDAEDVLAAALEWKPWLNLSGRERMRVARWAVQEWAIDLCPKCKGAKVVPGHDMKELEGVQPMVPCGDCRATGKRRYTDEERVEAMGKAFNAAMDEAHAIIAWAESLAIQRGKKMLERD